MVLLWFCANACESCTVWVIRLAGEYLMGVLYGLPAQGKVCLSNTVSSKVKIILLCVNIKVSCFLSKTVADIVINVQEEK